MTDQTPLPLTPPTPARRWLVTLADGTNKTITATACRTDCGCLVFSEASGMTVAMAAGSWSTVEQVQP